MGLKDLAKRFTTSSADLDKTRLQDRYCGLGFTPIADAPLRSPVRLVGEITSLRVVPRAGSTSVEIVLSDGTGRAVAVFTGRHKIAGLEPGRGLCVEGVGRKEQQRMVLLNPAYTLLS